MFKKILIGIVLVSLTLIVVACAAPAAAPVPSPSPKPAGQIAAKWIVPKVAGDIVSIPLAEVENNWNVHFKLETENGDMNFMAYKYNGKTYVRANICPPCHSIGYSLRDNILVCDTCATTFEAETGTGIEGACVNFPKAVVPYQVVDSDIVMSKTDLVVAYQDTIKSG